MHAHDRSHDHRSDANIRLAFFLNLSFALFELAGGLWTNSLAILSDALHDFGDSLSLAISWALEKYSKKPRTKTFSYGYKRFSLLSAFINCVILITGAVLILTEAIPRLFHPEKTHAEGMLIFSLIGIIVNGYAFLRLKRTGHSLNEQLVTWHLLEDVLGWAAILIASIVMIFKDIPVLDSLLSILISLYILWNTIKYLKNTLLIFLQGIPSHLDIHQIEQIIAQVSDVLKIHDSHIWSLDGSFHVLSMHVVVDPNTTLSERTALKCKIKQIAREFGIEHTTIEIEDANETCHDVKCIT